MSDPLVPLSQTQSSSYYYDVTGDSYVGQNLNQNQFKQYDLSDDRFPMGTRAWVQIQAEQSWNPNQIGDITPGLLPSEFTVGKNTPTPANAL